MWGYYRFAAQSQLVVPYVDRTSAYPGLFLAWVVVLVATRDWSADERSPAAGDRRRRGWSLVPDARRERVTDRVSRDTDHADRPSVLVAAFAVPVVFRSLAFRARAATAGWSARHAALLLRRSLLCTLVDRLADAGVLRDGAPRTPFVHLPVFVLAGSARVIADRRSHRRTADLGRQRPIATDSQQF